MEEKKFLDYEGLKILWSKILSQDYINSQTLIATINAIDETKADKTDLEKILSTNIVHGEKNILLSSLIDSYLLNIDYDNTFAFDTTELVVKNASAILGMAVLGDLILGQK